MEEMTVPQVRAQNGMMTFLQRVHDTDAANASTYFQENNAAECVFAGLMIELLHAAFQMGINPLELMNRSYDAMTHEVALNEVTPCPHHHHAV